MIVIINGSLGVGKSSVAEALHYRFPRSAFIEGDALGMVHPFEIYDAARVAHLYRCVAGLASVHAGAGYRDIVIDYVFESPESLAALVAELRGVDPEVRVFWLVCDEGEQAARIAARKRPELEWELRRFRELRSIQGKAAEQGFIGERVDTTGKGAEEVAAEILGLIGAR